MNKKEMEYDVILRYQNNPCDKNGNEVFMYFKGLVYNTILYLIRHPHYDDLVQEAFTAFVYALKSFDTSKGFRFSTYLVTAIHNRIGRYLKRNVHLFPCGSEHQKENKYYFKILEFYMTENWSGLKKFILENQLDEQRCHAVYQSYQIYDEIFDTESNSITEIYSAKKDNIIDSVAIDELKKSCNQLPKSFGKALIERLEGKETTNSKYFNRRAAWQLTKEGSEKLKQLLKKAEREKKVLWECEL